MEIEQFDKIHDKLENMTVKNHSYLYVTDQVGNYIQIGGYGDAFTAEKRIYHSPVDYVHTKAEYSDTKDGRTIVFGVF